MDQYTTADLYFAAFLKTAGVPYIEAVVVDSRVQFVFEKTVGIRELKNKYFSRTAEITALSFADEIRNLKAILHDTI